MALVPCKECGHQVSTQATSCPNCGAPISAAAKNAASQQTAQPKQGASGCAVILAAIGILALLLGLFLIVDIGGGDSTPRSGGGSTGSSSYDIEYRVTGTTTSASLTYQNQSGDTEQLAKAAVPWSKNFTVARGAFLYLSAQNNQDYGSITCEILVNGKSLKKATSQGAYVIAGCSGSAQ